MPWTLPSTSMAIAMDLDDFECDGCGACCGYYMIFALRADAVREPRIADEGQELAPWLETERWTYRLNPLPFHEPAASWTRIGGAPSTRRVRRSAGSSPRRGTLSTGTQGKGLAAPSAGLGAGSEAE